MKVYQVIKAGFRGVVVFSILLGAACSTPTPQQKKKVNIASGKNIEGKMTEGELQEQILRFMNHFSREVRDGLRDIESSSNSRLRDQALLRRLIYDSSALDICLGPSPQANLLDMVAFIELSQAAWNGYWVPKVFKAEGARMTQEFQSSSEQIWKIASEVLNEQQRRQLSELIRTWRKKNPDQIAVENVRFSDFSTERSARTEELQKGVRGPRQGITRGRKAA